jgi:predicted O-linked N-acetylglucosamine transferase (SPINDLY family)
MIDLKKLESAAINYEKAYNLQPQKYYSLGNLLHTQMHLCNWSNISSLQKNLPQKIANKLTVIEPFPLLSIIDNPELQLKCAEIYINHKFPENFDLPKISPYVGHSKIRIGYFSPDFRIHPVANLTAELYEIHDRDKFEVYAFSFGPDTKDEMNLRIKSGVDHFHDVRLLPHKEVALLSRSVELDIAVDLGGFTQDTRTGIFAMRAAPIQVNYLGYSGTMGAEYIDYLISDSTLIPKDKKHHYLEKIAYLPDSFMVNDTKNKASTREFTRKEAGLPEEGFVYSCFNHHYKITQSVFNSWMKILSQVEGSVLWLSDGNNTGVSNLKNEAEKRGVDSKRLIFAPRLDLREDHLNRIKLSDLFLDTLPYNAHATTSDALQVGLPVLTRIGKSFASRVAASLINSVNLPELITETQEQYEVMAIGLAKDKEKLKLIREKLKNNLPLSPLYDTPLYVKQLESAYEEMFERSQNGLEPDHIYVELKDEKVSND